MDVRDCTSDDFARLQEAWPAPAVWPSHWRRAASGAGSFLIAWDSDQPCGVAMIQWEGCTGALARSTLPGAIEINHVFVREESRGRGAATKLIGAAEEHIVARGHSTAVLCVDQDNTVARELYLHLGYVPTGVVDLIRYRYLDECGVEHEEAESSEAMVKALPSGIHS